MQRIDTLRNKIIDALQAIDREYFSKPRYVNASFRDINGFYHLNPCSMNDPSFPYRLESSGFAWPPIPAFSPRQRLIKAMTTERYAHDIQFLLKTACEFNLIDIVDELLQLNIFKNIDQPLQIDDDKNANGRTLLGLAAYHGWDKLIQYLIEKRHANVNAQDVYGNTPLHQVIYGDGEKDPLGKNRKEVVTYLLEKGSDLSIPNSRNETPDAAISFRRGWLGRLSSPQTVMFDHCTGYTYTAKETAPIIEKMRTSQNQALVVQAPARLSQQEQEALKVKEFCLDRAIREYVKRNKTDHFGYSSIEKQYGYATINDVYQALDKLSQDEWQHVRGQLCDLSPKQNTTFKFGLFSNVHSLKTIWDRNDHRRVQEAIYTIAIGIPLVCGITEIMTGSSLEPIMVAIAILFLLANYLEYKNVQAALDQKKRIEDVQQHDQFLKYASM